LRTFGAHLNLKGGRGVKGLELRKPECGVWSQEQKWSEVRLKGSINGKFNPKRERGVTGPHGKGNRTSDLCQMRQKVRVLADWTEGKAVIAGSPERGSDRRN